MRLGLCAAFIGALVLAIPSATAAHLGHVVLRAERYLKVDVGRDHVRVVVSLTLGPSEHRRVLEAADADADGAVTRDEADRYMAQWGEGLLEDLPLELDGAAVERPGWGEAYLDPIGPVRAQPGTVEMVTRLPLEAGTHRISLHDRMRRETFDRTDVAFQSRDGATLVASGAGDAPEEVVRALAFGRDADPARSSTFTARFELPGAADEAPERGPARWPLYLAAAAALAALALWLLRRRGPTSEGSEGP